MDSERLRDFEEMTKAWDEVSAASKVVECALPAQMSDAIARMIASRGAMENTVRTVGLRLARPTPSAPTPSSDRSQHEHS